MQRKVLPVCFLGTAVVFWSSWQTLPQRVHWGSREVVSRSRVRAGARRNSSPSTRTRLWPTQRPIGSASILLVSRCRSIAGLGTYRSANPPSSFQWGRGPVELFCPAFDLVNQVTQSIQPRLAGGHRHPHLFLSGHSQWPSVYPQTTWFGRFWLAAKTTGEVRRSVRMLATRLYFLPAG